jgi:hypothetical protein
VAGSLVPFGEPVGIPGKQVLHAAREVWLGGTEEEVKVVWHEDERQQLPTAPVHGLRQPLAHPAPIVIIFKNHLPGISSRGKMIDCSGELDS